MRLLKKINNNYAVAVDSRGQVVVVSGKGIGFGKFPYDEKDLSKIERTYYNVDNRFIELIKTLPDEIIKYSSIIVTYAEKELGAKLNPNLTFTLADHLNFLFKRLKQGIILDYGISYETKYLHSEESRVSKEVLSYLSKKLEITFPESEVAIIAMHLFEAQTFEQKNDNISYDKVIENIVKTVEKEMQITIKEDSFGYYRFATHIQYLLGRKKDGTEISSDNKKMFDMLKDDFQEVYNCSLKIRDYFAESLQWNLGEEEQLYLMLHINRLCVKEDCNQ
ncbi:MAG: PRD domain-containing protein [Longicatena sp.]